MDWLNSIVNEFEQLGRDIASGWNRAGEELVQLGQEITQSRDNAINYAEGLPAEIQDSLLNIKDAVLNDNWNPDNSYLKNSQDSAIYVPGEPYIPDVPIEPDPNPDPNPPNPPNPGPNPDPNPPNPPNPDPNPDPTPNPPIPNIPILPNDDSGEQHLEDLLASNTGTRAGMRLGGRRLLSIPESNSFTRSYYSVPTSTPAPTSTPTPTPTVSTTENPFNVEGTISSSQAFYEEIFQIGFSITVWGISWYLLSLSQKLTQSFYLLDNARMHAMGFNNGLQGSITHKLKWGGGRMHNGNIIGQMWRYTPGSRMDNGQAFPSNSVSVTAKENLLTVSSLMYKLNMPYILLQMIPRVVQNDNGAINVLSDRTRTELLQFLLSVGGMTIDGVLSALVAGVAFIIYDGLRAFTAYEKYDFPNKNSILPLHYHGTAIAVNNQMDWTAVKILSAVPNAYGVTDQEQSFKLIQALWSFGKDFRSETPELALKNLFDIYIPNAFNGKNLTEMLPEEFKSQLLKVLNVSVTDELVRDTVIKVVQAESLIKGVDTLLTEVGLSEDKIDGTDIFWKLITEQNITSVLKNIIVGFKSSETPTEIIANENLNILGFQFYHSDKQTQINENVGAGETSDNMLTNLELHGVYCGPGTKLPNHEPIDNLDRACMMHDIGYMSKGMYNKETDKEFVSALDKIINDSKEPSSTKFKAKAFKMHFERVIVNKYK